MIRIDSDNSCYEKQLIYPGKKLDYSWLCIRNFIYPIIVEENKLFEARVIYDGMYIELERLLSNMDCDSISNRIPVIAFGANRNVENLLWKLKKYDASDRVIIALPAYIENAESVVSSIFYFGHFYSDIIFDTPYSQNTILESTLLLLSAEQVYALNKSENVPEKDINSHWGAKIATINVVVPILGKKRIKALIYVSETIILNHPVYRKPVAFRDVFAYNRNIPEYSQKQLYEVFFIEGEGFTKKQVDSILSNLNVLWVENDTNKMDTYNFICEILKKYAWKDDKGNYINGEYLAKKNNLLLMQDAWWKIPDDYLLYNALNMKYN